jgi:hypothetical protein
MRDALRRFIWFHLIVGAPQAHVTEGRNIWAAKQAAGSNTTRSLANRRNSLEYR